MLLAKQNETFIEAQPDMRAQCPHCGGEVISKCGTIKIWHWAHKTECPYNTEPETEWHLKWKALAKRNGCLIEFRNNNHILDAFESKTKTVFEFQHSPISPEELKSRSMAAVLSGYKINWVFDYDSHTLIFYQTDEEVLNSLETDGKVYFRLKWYNSRYNSLLQNKIPIFGKVFLDKSNHVWPELIEIKQLNLNGRNGKGEMWLRHQIFFYKLQGQHELEEFL